MCEEAGTQSDEGEHADRRRSDQRELGIESCRVDGWTLRRSFGQSSDGERPGQRGQERSDHGKEVAIRLFPLEARWWPLCKAQYQKMRFKTEMGQSDKKGLS